MSPMTDAERPSIEAGRRRWWRYAGRRTSQPEPLLRPINNWKNMNSKAQSSCVSKNKKKKDRKRKKTTTASSSNTVSPHGRCWNVSDRYEKLGRIGEGTYGIVYKAHDKNTGQYVALKKCIPHNESSDGFPLTTIREIHSLRICQQHANIVDLQEITVSTTGVFLVFEYCPHDVAQLIDSHYKLHRKSPFREPQVKRLVFQLLSALEFMHSRHLIHRDIKLSNLLYSQDGNLKLADFGLSRKLGPSLTPKVVSLWYRPPELLLGGIEYTQAVDIWGVGCVFGELLEGVPLMDGKNEMDQIHKLFELLGSPRVSQWPDLLHMPLIKNGSLELPETSSVNSVGRSLWDRLGHLSATGLGLLSTLLSYDYHKRGTAKQSMESKYFTELPAMTDPTLMPKFPSQHRN